MNVTDLTQKKCVPCEGGMPSLTHEEIQPLLAQVTGWTVAPDEKSISKEYKFKNFKAALGFINQVADIAEAEGHHPDINLHDWNKVTLTHSTHAIGGLSANDFILAAKIDAL